MNIMNHEAGIEFCGLADCLQVGILCCSTDNSLTIERMNHGFAALGDYTAEELTKRCNDRLISLIHPQDRNRVLEAAGRGMAGGRIVLCFRIICKNDDYKWVWYSGQFRRDGMTAVKLWGIVMESPPVAGVQDSPGDGTRNYRSALQDYKIKAEKDDVMICEWDILSDTVTCTKNWSTKSGQEPVCPYIEDALKASRYIHPEDVPVFMALLDDIKGGLLYSSAELRILHENGIKSGKPGYIWFRIHAVTQFDKSGQPVKAVGMIFDINEEMQVIKKLQSRAERDALTGLYNREETQLQIQEYLREKPGCRCALFMIDTDNFKQVNDMKGHMLGDVVLAEMAAGMSRLMRDCDIVGRIGGDEFTILMKNITSVEEVRKKGEQLVQMFRHLFENEKKAIHITCSVGVALCPEDGKNFESLYKCADQALYQAKTQGKDRYMLYDKEHPVLVEESGYSSLGAAIDSEQQTEGISGDLISYIFKILYTIEDNDQAVNLILEIVGKRFDVSRAYVFENTEDEKYCSNTYEWCNEGISPEKGNLQKLEYSKLGEYKKLFGENSIFYCRDTSGLSPEQVALFKGQGIHSTLQCAFKKEDGFSGFVGFDECTGVRLWTKEEAGVLAVISQLIATFLQKRRLMERNRVIEQQLKTILGKKEEELRPDRLPG